MSLFPDLKANTNSNKFHLDLKSKITPVMQQWLYLKNKYSECILFFRMGDFYELFFDDAIKVAPILDLKLTTRGIDHNKKPIPLAGIPAKSLKYYLQKIIDKNIPVAVVEQDSKPITIKGKEFFPRDVTQVITPGTILDPDLISSKSNNYLMLINYKNKNNWGWAVCDVSTGEFNIAKFTSFQDLNNEAFKLKPSEILLNSSIQNNKEFLEEFKKIFPELTLNFLEPNLFEYDNTINNLYSHFNVNSLEGFGINEIDYVVGIESAGALLKTLNHRKIPFIASRLVTYSNTNYLEIDHIARKNLELDQNLRDGKLQGTLLSILDKTSTSMGARTLRSWFRKPLVEIKQINDRLDVVELFFKEYSLREDLIECFQQITDLERICTKIFYKGASPRDLKRLEESLLVLPVVVGILGSIPHSTKMNLMNTINSNITSIPEAINIINSALKADATIIQDGNFIKDNFSFDLDKLRDLKRNSKKFLLEFEKKEQEKINDLARQNDAKEPKLKVAYTRGHGYYIEVRSNVVVPHEYSISRSLKDRTRYTTSELLELANKILSAEEDIKNLELDLYKEVLNDLLQFIPVIKLISKSIAELDVLITFSHLANGYNFSRPELTEEIVHNIKNGRHPIVEQILNLGEFIPNSTILNNKDHSLLIISGANMGGKSTYLRQVALITIMAQIGCYIPAEHALIGVVDRIFTRVGIVDDIWKGQSHFMIEMIETANILNNASARSLVLLDEIGRGTSTNTGLAIAWAVSKYLHEQIKCRTLFATHYHQLNEMENRFLGINNYHMAVFYDNKTSKLKFLRRVEKGGTDESYGLEVAELAGFPEDVISEAHETRKLINEEMFFKNLSNNHNSLINQEQEKSKKKDQSKSKSKSQNKSSLLSYLHQNKSEIEKQIYNLDLDSITPIEALNLLHELKNKIKD